MAGTSDREFRASTADGEIVGWLQGDGLQGDGLNGDGLNGDGPKALLLHGGPGLSDYLGDLAAELAGFMTVARYQQRGLPPSATGGDRTVEGHVADAVAVLDSLGWERAWVIGHSWGGSLAMHVAVAHPDRVDGLVVLDSLGALPDGGAAAMGANLMRNLTEEQKAQIEDNDKMEMAGDGTADASLESLRILWPYYFGDPASAPPMPDMAMDLEGHLQTWKSVAAHFESATLEHELPLLRRPTIVIHGDASPIPWSEAERTAGLIPEARLRILPGVGHFAWLERAGLLRSELAAFVSSA